MALWLDVCIYGFSNSIIIGAASFSFRSLFVHQCLLSKCCWVIAERSCRQWAIKHNFCSKLKKDAKHEPNGKSFPISRKKKLKWLRNVHYCFSDYIICLNYVQAHADVEDRNLLISFNFMFIGLQLLCSYSVYFCLLIIHYLTSN